MSNQFKTKILALGLEEYIAILTLLCIFCFLIFRFLILDLAPYANYPLYIALLAGGVPLLLILIRNIFHLKFGSDLIAGVSIVTSVILGQYLAGSLVVLMLSGGSLLKNMPFELLQRYLKLLPKELPLLPTERKKSQWKTFL